MQGTFLRIIARGCVCYLSLFAGQTLAQYPAAAMEDVVAAVDDEPIYTAEVARLLNKVTLGHDVNPTALPLLKAQILEEIIDRRLVLSYARRTNSAPTPGEIDSEMEKLKSKLSSQRQTMADYFKSQSITETDLKWQITWNLFWGKYLAQYITDQRLISYFQIHHRDFDGAEVSVSHILLKPQKSDGPSVSDDPVKRAEAIRRDILSGKLSFAEAARNYSAGPSAKNGGELGFIPRHGVMDEAFSRAAFALDIGRVSEPVQTPFGVHLIRCNEIKPGGKQLNDVRKELEDAVTRELLEKLSAQERRFTSVKYTGKMPYLKPGTRELVLP